ncbi:alpha/beta hydrolase [Actinocorallia herbida]|uniref:alpha/beta hydrolase n=1 Tax=Actinocorallia herbida TaxID=58109 RepID=UPI001FEAF45D|nr:alpha/beta hydrolase [Actinocorallia herbida]
MRTYALLLPGAAVGPRTLPVIRRLTGLAPVDPKVEVVHLGEGVSVRVFAPPRPAPVPAPTLVWIHGGGYVIGSAAQEDGWCRRMAEAAGVHVVSVDYRLAPEHPYPVPVLDCMRALEWAADRPGYDASRLVIGGASAGGGLAAALALHVRDHSGITPALQLLTYPMLDDRSRTPDSRHRLWNGTSNAFGWRAYLGDADPHQAVPARRDDLAGLPPAWIGVGDLDLFRAEDVDYAHRLRAAGVPCTLSTFPGAFHGFDAIAPRTTPSRALFAAQVKAVATAVGTA